MQVIRLFDEVGLMVELKKSTLELIHATSFIKVIKKLVTAHDIIELNLLIEKQFSEIDAPPWDISALSDLSRIRRELVVYHRTDFNPSKLLDNYSNSMISLFNCIKTRKKLSEGIFELDNR